MYIANRFMVVFMIYVHASCECVCLRVCMRVNPQTRGIAILPHGSAAGGCGPRGASQPVHPVTQKGAPLVWDWVVYPPLAYSVLRSMCCDCLCCLCVSTSIS